MFSIYYFLSSILYVLYSVLYPPSSIVCAFEFDVVYLTVVTNHFELNNCFQQQIENKPKPFVSTVTDRIESD